MSAEGALRDGKPAGFELMETLRWEPDAGFVRLDRHLARLYASAHELGFAADPERIGETLRHGLGARVALRVRLTLAPNGDTKCVTQPYEPLGKNAVWKLAIAKTRISSADTLLRHKTTRRAVYDAARAEFSRDEADEVLLLNERGELCEGTITSLFVDMGDGGPLRTPALSSGLLRGVFRGKLIETGKAMEGVLTIRDLRAANMVFVGNSLRGLIEAMFLENAEV